MTKKILSVLCVAMTLFLLCGCSQKSTTADSDTSLTTESSTNQTVDFSDEVAQNAAISYAKAIISSDEEAVEALIPNYYKQIYEASNMTVADYAKTCISQGIDSLPSEEYTLQAQVEATASSEQITKYIFGIDLPENTTVSISQIKLVSVYALGENSKVTVYDKIPVMVCDGNLSVDLGMIDEASQYIN